MSSKTKIVVLRMKEIIYTAIFIGLGIILVTLLFIMFRPKKEPQVVSSGQVQAAQASYTPGLYRASLSLGSQNADLEVAVDADHINSISMTPLSDSVETMYPLMAPALEQLSEQICSSQSLENLTYPEGSQYTCSALVQAIESCLLKASSQ